MDCEKFESTLLDELYDELDEVTSAAAKRHVSGCARCAALFSGLKATRRMAVLPIVEPPADLEDRILAAAKEAQKVVPIGRRVSNVVSLAGAWAMRPQTAMAALFLLMTLGSSALLIKGKVAKPPSSTMIVSEQGEPVASVAAAPAADQALGGFAKDSSKTANAPAATAAAAPASSAYGGGDSPIDGLLARAPRSRAAEPDKPKGLLDDLESSEGSRGGGAAGAPPPPPAHYASLGRASPGGGAGGGNAQSAQGAAPLQAPAAPQALGAYGSSKSDQGGVAQNQQAAAPASAPASDFDNAMTAYNAGDYATATQLWDNGARNGDLNAALWEARSVRESTGCGAAAPRFDRVAQQAGVSAVANDAMFDAAKCYRALGQYDAARARLNQLLLVPSYINRAQNELNALNATGPKASAKARAAPQGTQQQQAPAAASPPPSNTANAY